MMYHNFRIVVQKQKRDAHPPAPNWCQWAPRQLTAVECRGGEDSENPSILLSVFLAFFPFYTYFYYFFPTFFCFLSFPRAPLGGQGGLRALGTGQKCPFTSLTQIFFLSESVISSWKAILSTTALYQGGLRKIKKTEKRRKKIIKIGVKRKKARKNERKMEGF